MTLRPPAKTLVKGPHPPPILAGDPLPIENHLFMCINFSGQCAINSFRNSNGFRVVFLSC
jgi:hypothetical protein